jgi:UDP-N-acetylmuramoyl-L-alanyl-D-glutamate--2,6-diaminopimelate ligase
MRISFADLLGGIQTERASGDPRVPITALCYDSRQGEPGSLFVALRGSYTDGHQYLADARHRGVVAALVESWGPEVDRFVAAAQVGDTRAVLAPIASRFYGYPGESLRVIGVTGTDGKTTTTYLIESMLRTAGSRTGLLGTIAIRVADRVIEHDSRQTTPESLEIQRLLAQMRDASVDWAIIEATSHGLALPRLDCCPFDIGVVTNITREHLDFHGTIEEYRRAKARLLERVDARCDRPAPRGVVLNADDVGARAIARSAHAGPLIWYSSQARAADIVATDIELGNAGTRFRLTTPSGSIDVRLGLIGRFNVDNALAAAGVGHLIGLSPEQVARGLGGLGGVPGRLRRIDLGQPFLVVVDYAHTPESLEKTLRLVRGLTSKRVIAVFGSAGERDRTKRPLQGRIGVQFADLSIFTSEDPRCEDPEQIITEIVGGAVAVGAVEGRDFLRIEDRRTAVRTAIERATPGDAVVLAGKGHERCMIYGMERRPWDEEHEAVAALQAHGHGLAAAAEGRDR